MAILACIEIMVLKQELNIPQIMQHGKKCTAQYELQSP